MTSQPKTPASHHSTDVTMPWQPVANVDGHYADWLVRRGLLTPDLEASLGAPVTVRVLAERHQPPPDWISDLTPDGSARGWYREITLESDTDVLVHATCFAPARTLAAHPWLETLGNRPLGGALAELDDTYRDDMQFAESATLGATLAGADAWARRSVFDVQGTPLYLVEHLSKHLARLPRETR